MSTPVRGVVIDLHRTLIGTAAKTAHGQQVRLGSGPGHHRPVPLHAALSGAVPQIAAGDARSDVQTTVARLVLAEHRRHAVRQTVDGAAPTCPMQVRAGLARLASRGIRIAVVADELASVAQILVERARLSQLVDVVVARRGTSPGRAVDDLGGRAVRALGLTPREVVVLGSSAGDVALARGLGARCVLSLPPAAGPTAHAGLGPGRSFADAIDTIIGRSGDELPVAA
ncbi:MAG: HAD family hydrolase [Actinomycetales bacterium]